MASAEILRAAHVEHTPGPWEAGNEAKGEDPRMVYCNDATGQRVADCTGIYLFHTDEVMRANAAFIVRACNAHYQMLEALKSARDQLRDLANDIPAAAWLTDETYAECSTLGAIDAAIAAAEAEAGR
jgi:hypothetical protein